jgi:hypothetical protein
MSPVPHAGPRDQQVAAVEHLPRFGLPAATVSEAGEELDTVAVCLALSNSPVGMGLVGSEPQPRGQMPAGDAIKQLSSSASLSDVPIET